VAGLLGIFEIDQIDLEKRKIALALTRAANHALDRVAGSQVRSTPANFQRDLRTAGMALPLPSSEQAKKLHFERSEARRVKRAGQTSEGLRLAALAR
jgi:hypothetical protein